MSCDRLEIDSATHSQIKLLCDRGDALADENKYFEAIDEYKKAWELIRDPKDIWEASTWVLAAIADSYFLLQEEISAKAIEALELAIECPGGLGNPFR